MITSLLIPSFLAGLLTFLAPCTLPLVPGYLGFISGISFKDLKDPTLARQVRRRVFLNGLLYVIGFSIVFIVLGSLISWLGGTLFAQYRNILSRAGGIFIIVFGLFMVQASLYFYEDRLPGLKKLRLPGVGWLNREHKLSAGKFIKPGNPVSSILFGGIFALGWTPCVGPVLGAILTLAATEATVAQGALLLAVFSLGLAVPFLLLASGIGYFTTRIQKLNSILPIISGIGGLFIVFLGVLVLTNMLGVWIGVFFQLFGFVNYESLLNYL